LGKERESQERESESESVCLAFYLIKFDCSIVVVVVVVVSGGGCELRRVRVGTLCCNVIREGERENYIYIYINNCI